MKKSERAPLTLSYLALPLSGNSYDSGCLMIKLTYQNNTVLSFKLNYSLPNSGTMQHSLPSHQILKHRTVIQVASNFLTNFHKSRQFSTQYSYFSSPSPTSFFFHYKSFASQMYTYNFKSLNFNGILRHKKSAELLQKKKGGKKFDLNFFFFFFFGISFVVLGATCSANNYEFTRSSSFFSLHPLTPSPRRYEPTIPNLMAFAIEFARSATMSNYSVKEFSRSSSPALLAERDRTREKTEHGINNTKKKYSKWVYYIARVESELLQ